MPHKMHVNHRNVGSQRTKIANAQHKLVAITFVLQSLTCRSPNVYRFSTIVF